MTTENKKCCVQCDAREVDPGISIKIICANPNCPCHPPIELKEEVSKCGHEYKGSMVCQSCEMNKYFPKPVQEVKEEIVEHFHGKAYLAHNDKEKNCYYCKDPLVASNENN